MGCHALLQETFLTQGSNPHLLHGSMSLSLAGGFFTARVTWEAPNLTQKILISTLLVACFLSPLPTCYIVTTFLLNKYSSTTRYLKVLQFSTTLFWLPRWLSVKNLPAKPETRVRSMGQKDSLEKEMVTPLQYSCLGNPMDRRAWLATVHGVAKEPYMTDLYMNRLIYASQ